GGLSAAFRPLLRGVYRERGRVATFAPPALARPLASAQATLLTSTLPPARARKSHVFRQSGGDRYTHASRRRGRLRRLGAAARVSRRQRQRGRGGGRHHRGVGDAK